MIAQNLVLHLVPDGIRPKLYLKQYDSGLEKLNFDLVETNTYYTIPTRTSINFIGTKPDGTAFSYACTWSGHRATCDVTEQMTVVPGLVECELRIMDSSSAVLGSISIDLYVERSALHESVCSCNDFKSANEEIISIHEEVAEAQSQADRATTQADRAKTQADRAATQATNVQTASTNAINSFNQMLSQFDGKVEDGYVLNYTASTNTLTIL